MLVTHNSGFQRCFQRAFVSQSLKPVIVLLQVKDEYVCTHVSL